MNKNVLEKRRKRKDIKEQRRKKVRKNKRVSRYFESKIIQERIRQEIIEREKEKEKEKEKVLPDADDPSKNVEVTVREKIE